MSVSVLITSEHIYIVSYNLQNKLVLHFVFFSSILLICSFIVKIYSHMSPPALSFLKN